MRPGHLRLTFLTLFVYGALKLLTAGWTILSTPAYFLWPIQLNGSELDMSGSAFSTLLHEEFAKNGLTELQDNSRSHRHRQHVKWSCCCRVYLRCSQDIQFQWNEIQHIHSGDCAHDRRLFRLEWSSSCQWYSFWFLRWKCYGRHDRDTVKTHSRVCSSRLWRELFYVAAGADSRCRLRAYQFESTPVRLVTLA